MLLISSSILSSCQDHVNFSFFIRLAGVSCFHSSSLILSSFVSFLNRRAAEIFLTPCAILSLVPEAVCCQFHRVSSHLVKIMFNSFHLQSECCPNYIILIPSLSCFNRSVVSIIPLLTGVSSKCFLFAKFIFYAFHFQPECCRN